MLDTRCWMLVAGCWMPTNAEPAIATIRVIQHPATSN